MKKLALAAFLTLASGPAFTQSDLANNQNPSGQNDCQCIGIGRPAHSTGPSLTSNDPGTKTTITVNTEGKEDALREHGLLYIYYEMLMAEIHMKLDAQKGE